MKTIHFILIIAGLTANIAIGQNITTTHSFGELTQLSPSIAKEIQTLKPIHYSTKAVLWNEDFAGIGITPVSTAGPTFTTANGAWTTGGPDGGVWKHSFYTTSGEWSTGTPPFASTSAANGFMLFDADSLNFPVSPNYVSATGELISPPIDLTGATSAILKMEQNFRWCCSPTHNINLSVSSDGGTTWGTPYNLMLPSSSPSDDFQASNGSYNISVNISGQAAGNTIQLKFTWDGIGSGSSHYFWNIDDLEISELPAEDIIMNSAYLVGENNGGISYGRTPIDQMDDNYFIGSEIYNGGANPAMNTTLTADFGAFTSTSSLALIEHDSTKTVETTEALSLTEGVYTGTYTVVSDGETAGAEFYNNIGGREFEITELYYVGNGEYSIDGIGVYTTEVNIGSLGTNSFTGGEDGLVCASLYHIKQNASIGSLRIMLAAGTVVGAEVYGSIKDTATFWSNDMTALYSSTVGVVSAAEIAVGYIEVYFSSPAYLTPGVYYAAVELYSNGGATPIRIADDETISQPNDASAIYIPGDQSYTNGNALGIRMIYEIGGLNENSLDGVSIYPNPSEGLVNVTNENNANNVITVYNMVGEVILSHTAQKSTTIDLSSQGTGIYMVKVTNENGSMLERVTIK